MKVNTAGIVGHNKTDILIKLPEEPQPVHLVVTMVTTLGKNDVILVRNKLVEMPQGTTGDEKKLPWNLFSRETGTSFPSDGLITIKVRGLTLGEESGDEVNEDRYIDAADADAINMATSGTVIPPSPAPAPTPATPNWWTRVVNTVRSRWNSFTEFAPNLWRYLWSLGWLWKGLVLVVLAIIALQFWPDKKADVAKDAGRNATSPQTVTSTNNPVPQTTPVATVVTSVDKATSSNLPPAPTVTVSTNKAGDVTVVAKSGTNNTSGTSTRQVAGFINNGNIGGNVRNVTINNSPTVNSYTTNVVVYSGLTYYRSLHAWDGWGSNFHEVAIGPATYRLDEVSRLTVNPGQPLKLTVEEGYRIRFGNNDILYRVDVYQGDRTFNRLFRDGEEKLTLRVDQHDGPWRYMCRTMSHIRSLQIIEFVLVKNDINESRGPEVNLVWPPLAKK